MPNYMTSLHTVSMPSDTDQCPLYTVMSFFDQSQYSLHGDNEYNNDVYCNANVKTR